MFGTPPFRADAPLMLLLTVCFLHVHGQVPPVSKTPGWPTTGCTFTRHEEMYLIDMTSYTYGPLLCTFDECESLCLGDWRCGSYVWSTYDNKSCSHYQGTPQLMADITGTSAEMWRKDSTSYNMGSKDCDAVISEPGCSNYVAHDGKKLHPTYRITMVSMTSNNITAAQCQALCDAHERCKSVWHHTLLYGVGRLWCDLYSTSITELMETGQEDGIINAYITDYNPISTTYDCNVDECTDNTHDCDTNSECSNTPGGFTCGCKPGYAAYTCTDVDECTDNTHDCDTNAGCTNTPGGFTCQCNAGFTGDGVTCTDIDECADDAANNCFVKRLCTNTPGSFTCQCPPGQTGDGVTCTAIPVNDPVNDPPGGCFYINSNVKTPTGPKFMGDLDPGDQVLTRSEDGGMRYEKVIMDIHRLPELETWFRKIQTQSNSIMVTPKHFLYAGKHPDTTQLVTSEDIKVGDYLLVNMNESVGVEEVVKVEMVYDRGISNPVVASGRVLVNEILASVYPDVSPLTPKSTHTLLWLMRMFNTYDIQIMDEEVEGIPGWAYYAALVMDKFT